MNLPDTTDEDMTIEEANVEVHERFMESEDSVADAVINAIGFRVGDLFYWESDEIPEAENVCVAVEAEEFGVLEVADTNQYSRGLGLKSPGQDSAESWDVDVIQGGYNRLYRDWKRGDVVPVETTYHRADTGEQVEA